MDSTRAIIVRLLSNLGSTREVDQYLKLFSSIEADQFAVIKVGGGVIESDLENLVSALSFLHKVGLLPIVIHGAGGQLNRALEEAGIHCDVRDGLRFTSHEVLEIARKTFQRVNLSIVEALENLGTRARPIASGVFEADFLDRNRYGFVGRVTGIHTEPIEAAIRARHLPVLACLGETGSGQILNVNADVAAVELAAAMKPYKIIFLTPTGGLLDDHGRIISAINLVEDYDRLMAEPWLHSGMRLKLQQIKDLLERLPPHSSVSIASPEHLAKELFTHQGWGTLIRKGERIRRYETLADIDLDRLRLLLEACFGRTLIPDYFNTRAFRRVYLADSYRATAIITDEAGTPYLDKFAVTAEAQGIGLGGSIWNRMRADLRRLYWRSRSGNPINTWYFQQAQGSYRTDDWVVFWYGFDRYDDIRDCVEHALALPASLGPANAENTVSL